MLETKYMLFLCVCVCLTINIRFIISLICRVVPTNYPTGPPKTELNSNYRHVNHAYMTRNANKIKYWPNHIKYVRI